jgi:DNA-binding CsgD family transcriptional regulator
MLVVDRDGRVMQMNKVAGALVSRQHPPLRLKDGHIQAANEPDTERIQRLIAIACSSENGAMPGIGGSLLMLAHGGTASAGLAVSVTPFADSRLFGGDHPPRAAILTNEVAPRNLEDFETGIRELFGLTRAEAKLAVSLACGLSLRDSTDRTNLTVKTGRSYLERIFAKTGTRQQSELVAVLKTVQPLSGRCSGFIEP